MIRDPASFQLILDAVARLVCKKLIPREREVTETEENPAYIMAKIAAGRRLLAANCNLIARFKKKNRATLARVWGEDAAEPPYEAVGQAA